MSPYKSEDANDDDDLRMAGEHKTARIRRFNDGFRKSGVGGTIVLTQGVNALSESDRTIVLGKVRAFEAFNPDNDPHGEHDFVRVEHDGTTYFGKIDYYAKDMKQGSEDPGDPNQTARVLTIMRADEY